jgi:hypothetical protein
MMEDEDMKDWAKNRGKDEGEDSEEEDKPKAAPGAEGEEPEDEEDEEGGEDEEGMSSEEKDELVELVRRNLDEILEAVKEVDVESFIAVDEELDDDAADQVIRDLESMTPELADELEGISEADAADVAMQVREDVAEQMPDADDTEFDKNTALVAAFLFRAGELV